jgi:hypothetical protein
MLRPDGYIKVLDFGLARQAGSDRADGELPVGTVGYMSPEEVMQRPITAASDIFSLGVVLYELASGTNPFRGDSAGATTRLIQGLAAPPLPAQAKGVPQELDRLVRRMLSKSPADRPAASEVALRLEAIAQPRKFRRRGIGVAAVLAICALGGTAIWRGLPLHRADGELTSETNPDAKGIRLRQFTTTLEENRVTAAAISPDGRHLVYAERNGPLISRDIGSAEVRAITLPKNVIATEIAWFPSGSELLLGTESTAARMPSLWKVSFVGNEPRLLRENARLGVPSPAGNAIAFASSDRSEVLVADAEGQHARRLIAGGRADAFPVLVWSADGRRLSYQRRHYAPRGGQPQLGELENDYQRSYESISVESGERLAAQPNMRIGAACETSGAGSCFCGPILRRRPSP